MTSPTAAGAVLVLAIAALAHGPARAQPLEAALQRLIVDSPEIRAAGKSLEAAGKGVDGAFAGYLPRIDAVGESGPENIDSPLLRDTNQPDWNKVKQVAGLTVTQKLFDGFATPSGVRTARLTVEVAEFTLAGTRQDVLFRGIRAYIDVLRQRRLVELARLNESTIRRQLDLEDERVQRGAGIAVDVLQAKSRLQIALERRVAFEGALQSAVARYVQVFGHPPTLDAMVEPVPPESLLPGDLDQGLRIADRDNPLVNASRATVEIARERRRAARADYYPSVDVVAEANYEKDVDLVEGERRAYSLVLRATWNLFNGFATRAGVAQAAADYRASQDNHETAIRRVSEEIRLAWNELDIARRRVSLLENAVDIASEVFVARGRLREIGRETVINVLDAENEVNNARINLVDAAADAKIAVYRLLQGLGWLDAGPLGLALD
ncbi:MAG: TolC family outer membrane protein [Rhodospirillales bacterium]